MHLYLSLLTQKITKNNSVTSLECFPLADITLMQCVGLKDVAR